MKAYPFIHKHPTSGQTSMAEGMDLRDYFAGLVMQAILTNHKLEDCDDDVVALNAYQMADFMMEQREVKREHP
jgi:hypothetical protein